MNTRSGAQRRFLAECAAMAIVALLWLARLAWGLGGPRATQAISSFGLIGASALSWASGQAAWTWYETVLGREVPFPSLADIGYLAAPPLAAAALLTLPFAAQSLAGRVRQVLDGLMIAASLLLASWGAGAEPAVPQRRRRPAVAGHQPRLPRSGTWSSAPSSCSSWPGRGWARARGRRPCP